MLIQNDHDEIELNILRGLKVVYFSGVEFRQFNNVL